MTSQSRLEAIERGNVAVVVSGAIADTLADREAYIVSRLRALYRTQQLDPGTLIGLVGELVALDDLREDLESTQRRGITAANKEFGNG